MDVLTALSLTVADSFWTDDCDTCDWLRTEAAAADIALSESPQDAIAVAPNATTSTDKATILTPAMLWIVLNIPMLPFLPDIFSEFMPSSFAADLSPHLWICDLVNNIFLLPDQSLAVRALAHAPWLLLFFLYLLVRESQPKPLKVASRGTKWGNELSRSECLP
jgi:hypothetical protein